MRVAIYARVSTDDKGQDVENQLMQLRDYCKAKGYSIFKEYTEYITGTGKKRRPAFEEMMEDARKRKFDILLVWSYDRFSRAGLKDIHFINDLNEWGVKFVSYQESFLDTTSEMGELLLPIFAWIAKQEAKKISERTKAGLQRARSEGKNLGRPKAEVNPQEILALRQQGLSLVEIANKIGCSKETVRRRLSELEKTSMQAGSDSLKVIQSKQSNESAADKLSQGTGELKLNQDTDRNGSQINQINQNSNQNIEKVGQNKEQI